METNEETLENQRQILRQNYLLLALVTVAIALQVVSIAILEVDSAEIKAALDLLLDQK